MDSLTTEQGAANDSQWIFTRTFEASLLADMETHEVFIAYPDGIRILDQGPEGRMQKLLQERRVKASQDGLKWLYSEKEEDGSYTLFYTVNGEEWQIGIRPIAN